MPGTPGEHDVPAPSIEGAGESDLEFLARSKLQVALVVATGAVVIMLTTAIVVFLGRGVSSVADGPSELPTSASVPELIPSPGATPTISATPGDPGILTPPTTGPSTSRKTTAPPGQTTAPPTTAGPTPVTLSSINCEMANIPVGVVAKCVVVLSALAPTGISINLSAPSNIAMPPNITIPGGSPSASFDIEGVTASAGQFPITASWDGKSVAEYVSVSEPVLATVLHGLEALVGGVFPRVARD